MPNSIIRAIYNENVKHKLTTINGNGNSTASEYYYSEAVPTSHITKQGYTFAGYTIDPSDLVYTSIANGNIQFNMPDRDVKITEKWNKIPISSVTLNISSPLNVSIGESPRKLTATINPSTVFPMPSIQYTSNNACVAIDAIGNMTFKSTGTATITATANDGSGKKATLTVKVNRYELTVNGSTAGSNSGAGYYNKGQDVTINAGNPIGRKFIRWDHSSNIRLANANNAITTFVFPGNACSVTAIWEDLPKYTVTLNGVQNGSSGNGSYFAGETVTVNAGDTDGYKFSNWVMPSVNVTTMNTSSPITSFIMPANNVTLTAIFDKAYNVIVNESNLSSPLNGTGKYKPGENVTVNAGSHDYKYFVKWSAPGTTLQLPNKAITNFTMPSSNVKLIAQWMLIPSVTYGITRVSPTSIRYWVQISNVFGKSNIMNVKIETPRVTGIGSTNENGYYCIGDEPSPFGSYTMRVVIDGNKEFRGVEFGPTTFER